MEIFEDVLLRIPIDQVFLPLLKWLVLWRRQHAQSNPHDMIENDKLNDPNEPPQWDDLAVSAVVVVPVEIVEGPRVIENANHNREPHAVVYDIHSHLYIEVDHDEQLRQAFKNHGEQVLNADVFVYIQIEKVYVLIKRLVLNWDPG